MAKVYQDEGNLEHAYVIYFKFITLFVEKILAHPEYKAAPANLKKPNRQTVKEVLPVAEQLKAKLLERYEVEYRQFLINKEAERAKEAERNANAVRNKSGGPMPASSIVDPSLDIRPFPTAPMDMLDQVVYPNDFPSSSNKSNLPTGGLLLPDSNKSLPK